MANLLTVPADLDRYKLDWVLAQSDARLREELVEIGPRGMGAIGEELTPAKLREHIRSHPGQAPLAKLIGNRVIPRTPIDELVRALPQDRAGQIAAAEHLRAAILAGEFERSVELFREYNNAHDDLSGERRFRKATRQGALVADALRGTRRCAVGDRRELDFEFAEFEVPPARSRHRARYRGQASVDGKRGRRFPTIDVLLTNANDKLPIIGEVKVARDKTPFAALVQLLQYAYQSVTEPQLLRLMRSYPDAGFRIPRGGPYVDLYVLLVDFPDSGKSTELEPYAHDLAQGLMAQERFRRYVRRIAFLKGRSGGASFTCDGKVYEGA